MVERHPESGLPINRELSARVGVHNTGYALDRPESFESTSRTVFEDCDFLEATLFANAEITGGKVSADLFVEGDSSLEGLRSGSDHEYTVRLGGRATARDVHVRCLAAKGEENRIEDCRGDSMVLGGGEVSFRSLVDRSQFRKIDIASAAWTLRDVECDRLRVGSAVTLRDVRVRDVVDIALSSDQPLTLSNVRNDGFWVAHPHQLDEIRVAEPKVVLLATGSKEADARCRADMYVVPLQKGYNPRVASLIKSLMARTDDLRVDGRNKDAFARILEAASTDKDGNVTVNDAFVSLALRMHRNP